MAEQEKFDYEAHPHRRSVGNYMDCSIINQAEIDPIVALILKASAQPCTGKYYFEIAIPHNHAFEHERILHFFSDATIFCHRGRPNILKGTATDPQVGQYIYDKWRNLA